MAKIRSFNHKQTWISGLMDGPFHAHPILTIYPLLAMMSFLAAPAAADVRYVDASAGPGGDGLKWGTAYQHLQDAIAGSQPGSGVTQIWVARGTYMPDGGYTRFGDPPSSHVLGTGTRATSFNLIDSVSIYGGFGGSETMLDQRSIVTNPTILSGDRLHNDGPSGSFQNYTDNSLHVISVAANITPSTLDGFIINAGFADGPFNDSGSKGAGLNNASSGLLIENCRFALNSGSWGAALFNSGSIAVLGCTFEDNCARCPNVITNNLGAAIHSSMNSSLLVQGSTFTGNKAASHGGAIYNTQALSVSIENCSFTGNTLSQGGGSHGGAVYSDTVANLTIRGSNFDNNGQPGDTGSAGGAIYVTGPGSGSVSNCMFTLNKAARGYGGAIAFESAPGSYEVSECTFSQNSAGSFNGSGGALTVSQSSLSVSRCRFVGNSSASVGGAVAQDGGSTSFVFCQFIDNLAFVGGLGHGHGGAVRITPQGGGQTSATFTNCGFLKNRASGNVAGDGGAIQLDANATLIAVNCRFRKNQATGSGIGGAMRNQGVSSLINCTFSGNSASTTGGVWTDNDLAVSNCIFWQNTQGSGSVESAQIRNDQSGGLNDVQISHTCIEGLTGILGGVGNIGSDPLFINPDGPDLIPGTEDDDLRLQSGSPCVDAGNSLAVPQDLFDLDEDLNTTELTPIDLSGNVRFFNDPFEPDTGVPVDIDDHPVVVDIGAYEFFREDCNSNGRPDEVDILLEEGGTCVGPPCTGPNEPTDCCSHDCNQDGKPDECQVPLLCLTCPDCNTNGVPDECELTGPVDSSWVSTLSGGWNSADNWCQRLVPSDGTPAGNSYYVTIPSGTGICTLDISPTISALTIQSGAALEVNSASGPTVLTLVVQPPNPMIQNDGTIRAKDAVRLLLDASDINQDTTSGVIEAVGLPGQASKIQINGRTITGGTIRTNGDSAVVELLGGAVLDNVTVEGNVVSGAAATVSVPAGQTGVVAQTVFDEGVISVGSTNATTASYLSPSGNAAFTGSGRISMKNKFARLGDFKGSIVNMDGHLIEGAGRVFGTFTNLGGAILNANNQTDELTISAPGSKSNDGTMQATDGGILRIADNITGSGRIVAQGGRVIIVPGVSVLCDDIDVPPGSVSHLDIGVSPPGAATATASNLNISGGIVNIAGGSIVTLTGAATVCPAASPPGSVAELHLNNATLNAGNLDICDGGVLTVASSINLTDSFANAMTDGTASPGPAHWSWGTGSILSMAGGQSPNLTAGSLVGWARLEAASDDDGPSGGTNNFKFANIALTAGAHVSLVDFNANGTSGQGEAVYCENLNLGSGSVLNLNGLSFYRSQPTPQQVTPGPLDGGMVIDEPRGISGDCSGDGVMNEADLECFVEVLLELDTNPAHVLLTDLNTDGVVDGRDVQMFVTNALGG